MKPGTLVLLKIPSGYAEKEGLPKSGAIGEVKEPTPAQRPNLEIDCVSVEFPNYPSPAVHKNWDTPIKWLTPISGPDIDITEKEDKPVEDLV